MFFLLRMAFWLGVVCVLLPSARTTAPDSQIDATQAMSLATAAVSDARGFCERQPDACKVGGKVAVALSRKAESGALTLYEMVSTKLNERAASDEKAAAKTDHGTLTQQDLSTPWQGRVPLPPRRAERPARPSA